MLHRCVERAACSNRLPQTSSGRFLEDAFDEWETWNEDCTIWFSDDPGCSDLRSGIGGREEGPAMPRGSTDRAWTQGLTITDEQKQSPEPCKEFGPKMKDVMKKNQDILTPEQKKAEAEAVKAAEEAGKKGKEIDAAVAAHRGPDP